MLMILARFNVVSITAFKTHDHLLYFMKEEPTHQELKASVAGKLAKNVMMLDFVSGDATAVFNF
jgi:hypothetical protein